MLEPEAAHAAHDILQVLSECHAQGICYADVKPANFLLKRAYSRKNPASHPLELRVADFGCSQRLQEVQLRLLSHLSHVAPNDCSIYASLAQQLSVPSAWCLLSGRPCVGIMPSRSLDEAKGCLAIWGCTQTPLVQGCAADECVHILVQQAPNALLACAQSGKLHKRTGTPLYMAPELFMRYYGVESDQVPACAGPALRVPFACAACCATCVRRAVLRTPMTSRPRGLCWLSVHGV